MRLCLLSEDAWRDFSVLRLQALAECPSFFGSPLEAEQAYDEAEWRDMLVRNSTFVFALRDEQGLAAMQGVSSWRQDPSSAIIWGSYAHPRCRGQGHFGALYQACIECGRENEAWRRLVVSHRADNPSSQRVILKAGFVPTHTEKRLWPDGAEVEEPWYELDLVALRSAPAANRADIDMDEIRSRIKANATTL